MFHVLEIAEVGATAGPLEIYFKEWGGGDPALGT